MGKSSRKIIKYIGFYGAAVLLNIMLNKLVNLLGLPIFMDSVGTITAAAVGGYLPGIIVGYLTNIINMYADTANAYYAVINAMLAILAAYLADKGFFKSFLSSVRTIPLFALIGGAVSSVITYLIYGFGLGEGISAPFAKTLLDNGVFNVFWAQFISDIALDIIDKAITVAIVYVLIRVIPEKIKKDIIPTFWKQTPLTKDEQNEATQNSAHRFSLRKKIIILISVVMIFIAVVTIFISYVLYHDFAAGVYSIEGIDTSSLGDMRLNEISFVTRSASLFMGFFIMILVLCIWLAKYSTILPVNSMTMVARNFTYDDVDSLSQSVKRLQDLKISTNDEIESLYDSLSGTIAKTVEFMKDVKVKGDELAHIQNGLIYVLADLVESRDQNTGDHVRKTAAYVRMILLKMQERGMYPDIINDEYIEDVSNSAPLHDIGKIKVSDVILNKPGRLNDEEFEIMKTHTVAGSEIIAKAMELVSDTGYLKEARNLATFHHEKWNGTGYPYGLSKEDIPLSARIMAIADVFDALVSKRSYKNAFTVDDAMKIIRDGMGTHFDPGIAQLFLDSEDEIRKIAGEHLQKLDAGEKVILYGEDEYDKGRTPCRRTRAH